jgi:hypothetical protein
LVDKSIRAVAFLALMFAVLGHNLWPFPEASAWILQAVADGSTALPELIAARAIVGLLAVVVIVGSYRLVLAALGLDRGKLSVTFEQGRIIINGQAYDCRNARGFELEPHPLARQEEHRDRPQQIATPLYYRNSYVIIIQYGERQIEIATFLGQLPATRLLARLQMFLVSSTDVDHKIGISPLRIRRLGNRILGALQYFQYVSRNQQRVLPQKSASWLHMGDSVEECCPG